MEKLLFDGVQADFEYRKYTYLGYYPLLIVIAWITSDTHNWWINYSFPTLLAFILSALGATIRAAAGGYLPESIIMDNKLRMPKLVDSGPFSVVRNPLYLGTYLISLSPALTWNLFTLLFGIVYCYFRAIRIITYEEKELSGKFGEAYEKYKKNVPRVFPNNIDGVFKIIREKTDWKEGFSISIWAVPFPVFFLLSLLRVIPRSPYLFYVFIGLSYATIYIYKESMKKK